LEDDVRAINAVSSLISMKNASGFFENENMRALKNGGR
jgi:hypothetical protein